MAGISVFVAFFALFSRLNVQREKKKKKKKIFVGLMFNLFRQYCFSARGQSQTNLMPYFIYATDWYVWVQLGKQNKGPAGSGLGPQICYTSILPPFSSFSFLVSLAW